MVDLAQIGRGDSDLYGAGHGEGRISVDADCFACRQVEGRNAHVAGCIAEDGPKLLLQTRKARRRRRMYRLQGKDQQPEKDSNETHGVPLPASYRTSIGIIAESPHTFQIVKTSHFGTK